MYDYFFDRFKNYTKYCNEILRRNNSYIYFEDASDEYNGEGYELFLKKDGKDFYIDYFTDFEMICDFLVPFYNYLLTTQ